MAFWWLIIIFISLVTYLHTLKNICFMPNRTSEDFAATLCKTKFHLRNRLVHSYLQRYTSSILAFELTFYRHGEIFSALMLRRTVKFINSHLSTQASRQNFPWQKNSKPTVTVLLRNLDKNCCLQRNSIWHLNEQFVPYRTGDIMFSTISVTLL